MGPDLRKVWVVASTEFGSSVRTKSFIMSLLALPIIMGASILLQTIVADRADVKTRRFVVVDESGTLLPAIAKHRGLELIETIPITVTRENMRHSKNAITKNTLLHFQIR